MLLICDNYDFQMVRQRGCGRGKRVTLILHQKERRRQVAETSTSHPLPTQDVRWLSNSIMTFPGQEKSQTSEMKAEI